MPPTKTFLSSKPGSGQRRGVIRPTGRNSSAAENWRGTLACKAVDAIVESGITDEAIAHWQQGRENGFVYDLLFCQIREPRHWADPLRDEIGTRGLSVGHGPNIVGDGTPRRTWQFRGSPSSFRYPGADFVFFLEDFKPLRGDRIPGLAEVSFGARILDGRVFYMFADDPGICFEDGSRVRNLDDF